MEEILKTMRAMAWERAKGELQAVLQTYWGSLSKDDFGEIKATIDTFIRDFEEIL